MSAAVLALAPAAFVTMRSLTPVPAGTTTVIEVRLGSTVYDGAFAAPTFTPVMLAKLVPVTVTWFPPDSGPVAGLIAVTVGNWVLPHSTCPSSRLSVIVPVPFNEAVLLTI
ncbi:hypothetical protein GCM10027456_71090 [Kineosporia babensis]